MNSRIIKNIYDLTVRQISFGAGNIRNPSESEETYNERESRVYAFRALAQAIFEKTTETPAHENLSPVESDFLITFLDSINALHNEAGNCCEYAALTFVNLLKQQIGYPIEVIFIGNKNNTELHDFIVLGRPSDSIVKELGSWKNVAIVDTWPGAKQGLKFYSGNETPGLEDLLAPYMHSINFIVSRARSEKPLTSEQWLKYADFLVECRKHVTPNIFGKIALEHKLAIDVNSEYKNYLKTMNNEISAFRAKAFMIQYWNRDKAFYSLELFRPKSFNAHSAVKSECKQIQAEDQLESSSSSQKIV